MEYHWKGYWSLLNWRKCFTAKETYRTCSWWYLRQDSLHVFWGDWPWDWWTFLSTPLMWKTLKIGRNPKGKDRLPNIMFSGSVLTRWWFPIFSIFTPWGRWTQFDEHMFQSGWFNHQLVKLRGSRWQFHFFTFLTAGWTSSDCCSCEVSSSPALAASSIHPGKWCRMLGFRWMSLSWGSLQDCRLASNDGFHPVFWECFRGI